jgi:hypothetical protein
VTSVLLGYATTVVAAFALDLFTGKARPALPAPSALPARLACIALLFGFWLGVFDRPWLGAFAAVVTLAIFALISRRKRQLVGEPLVFSDFGLVEMIIRHPDLYYTEALTSPPALAGLAATALLLAGWLWLEPALLPALGSAALAIGILLVVLSLFWAARRPPLAKRLLACLPRPALERHLAGWGLLLTLVAYTLRWRAELDRPFDAPPSARPLPFPGRPADLVVVVQLESFMDPAEQLGAATPPGLLATRERAILHGRLRVPAHGAYTMRSEFAVLSGLSERELGFRRFDPYLSTAMRDAVAAPTLASRLRQHGYRTLFMHPFRPGFFKREQVVARLGFETSLWEDDLAGAARSGPYVDDPALAERLLAEIGSRTGPVFAMAVTMENHGPWPPERLPGGTDARGQYLRHLASSDRAITRLIDGLADYPGRVVLCLYGDHPPILQGHLRSDDLPETDYVLIELGRLAEPAPTREMALSADELGRIVMSRAFPAGSGAGRMG